jgi:hypothetical protein
MLKEDQNAMVNLMLTKFYENLTPIPDYKQKKLNPKSQCYIMIGYSKESKSYPLSDPIKQEVISGQDVIFLK